jgi:probable phosphoglycerate mutase
MPSTRICLVRHGETAWNAEGRVQGQTDIPLSAVGHAQARAAASILAQHDFSAIYSSDLLRVRQTAEPAAQRLALQVALDRGLRERHYGIFECLLYTEVKQRFPEHYARFRDKDPEFDFDTGESLRAFFERALAASGCSSSRTAACSTWSIGTSMRWDFRRRASSESRTRVSTGSSAPTAAGACTAGRMWRTSRKRSTTCRGRVPRPPFTRHLQCAHRLAVRCREPGANHGSRIAGLAPRGALCATGSISIRAQGGSYPP